MKTLSVGTTRRPFRDEIARASAGSMGDIVIPTADQIEQLDQLIKAIEDKNNGTARLVVEMFKSKGRRLGSLAELVSDAHRYPRHTLTVGDPKSADRITFLGNAEDLQRLAMHYGWTDLGFNRPLLGRAVVTGERCVGQETTAYRKVMRRLFGTMPCPARLQRFRAVGWLAYELN